MYFEWKPKERPQDHIPFILKALFYRIEKEASNNNDYLFYEVPQILPEFPWYNAKDTAETIANKIAKKGFIVKIMDQYLFICWNKKELEKRSKVKINFETKEDTNRKLFEKMELINENRYDYFINPSKSKNSKINFETATTNTSNRNVFDIETYLQKTRF